VQFLRYSQLLHVVLSMCNDSISGRVDIIYEYL